MTVSERYTPDTYDILNNNCNNFSEECAQFLLGQAIPEHILEAPRKLSNSCLGRIGLFICGLSSLARTASILNLHWVFSVIGIAVLSSLSKGDACLVAEDSTIHYAISVFVMECAYAMWLLLALFFASKQQRPFVTACVNPVVESIMMAVLGLLSYSAAVAVSALQTSMNRLFPDDCTPSNANYQKMQAGTWLPWAWLPCAWLPWAWLPCAWLPCAWLPWVHTAPWHDLVIITLASSFTLSPSPCYLALRMCLPVDFVLCDPNIKIDWKS